MKSLPSGYGYGYSAGYGFGNHEGGGFGYPSSCKGFLVGAGFLSGEGYGSYPVKVVLYETKNCFLVICKS